MNAHPSFVSKTLAVAAASVAVLAAPCAASAAPDWTPPQSLPGHSFPTFGYAGGEETEAHLELVSASPPNQRLIVSARGVGSAPQTQLEIPTTAGGFPFDAKIAVAPRGEAVLVWRELQLVTSNSPARFHVRYRSAAGVWEPDKVVLSDDLTLDRTGPSMDAAIGPDGTAAVAIDHHEKDDPGEAIHDQRADVVTHPAGGEWESPFRLSAPNRSSNGADIGVDGAGNITATYAERYNETTGKTTALIRRRSASNKVWTTPEDITQSAPNNQAFAPRLSVAPDGRAVIALQRDRVAVAAVRESAAGQFGTLTRVNEQTSDAGASAAAIAPDGTAYVAYVVNGGAEAPHLGIVRAAPGGSFSAPRRVSPTGLEGVEAGIAFAGNNAVVGWTGRLTSSGTDVVQGTRWGTGSALPDAFHDLDSASGDSLAQVVGDGEGSAVVVWSTALDAHTATFDAGGPEARSADVPQAATAGEPATLRASFADRWSPLAGDPSWDFGDGTSAAGGEVAHAWSAPGDYQVTLRASDTFGNVTERRFPVHVAGATAAPEAPTQPGATAPAPAPKVTLKAPKCSPKLSKAACKRFLTKPAAWKKVAGTASDAARVTITVKRNGSKTRTVKAIVNNGKWTARLTGLKAGGTTTISAQAFAADGAKSKPAQRKLRLRR
jgi:hypothetical protein